MKFEMYRYKIFVQCAFQLETWMQSVYRVANTDMPILPYALIMVAIGTHLLSKSKNKNWLIYTFAIHAELRTLPFWKTMFTELSFYFTKQLI
jgi:hypothetical protein